jgi:hypothetical protein
MPAHGFRNSWQLRSVVWVEQSTDHGHPRKEARPSMSASDRYFA